MTSSIDSACQHKLDHVERDTQKERDRESATERERKRERATERERKRERARERERERERDEATGVVLHYPCRWRDGATSSVSSRVPNDRVRTSIHYPTNQAAMKRVHERSSVIVHSCVGGLITK